MDKDMISYYLIYLNWNYLPVDNSLATDWIVFVNTEIKHMNFSIHSVESKHCAGVRRPGAVCHLIIHMYKEYCPFI